MNKILRYASGITLLIASNQVYADLCADILPEIAKQLSASYVIEETAVQLSELILSEAFEQECAQQSTQAAVANFVTEELNKIAQDKHLSVIYDPSWVAEVQAYQQSDQSQAFADSRTMEIPTDNYGFKKVEMLEGNIGYLDVRMFADSHLGGETVESAMKFLQHADGMIVDLRNNFGGSPFMEITLASYFFDVETVLFSTFESRQQGTTEVTQNWTSPYVPGPRFANVPLFILTSSNSASAAEGFAYGMQNLERATLVGEVTAGAAHVRRTEIISDGFLLSLPAARPVNPVSQSNWEGVGVQPDILVASDDALLTAHAEILNVLQAVPSSSQALHQWAHPLIQAQAKGFSAGQEEINQLIGHFGQRKITYQDGKLWYGFADEAPYELEFLSKDLLTFKAFSDARIELVYKGERVSAIKLVSFGSEPREYARSDS